LAQQAADASKLPPKKEISFETKDGVLLKATYYPGTKDKESVPVILLHGFRGSRRDMEKLAAALQREDGDAVIVPDLRGHGDSTRMLGTAQRLDPDRMPADHFQRMVQFDLEEVKKFLKQENNAGRLNLDKLSIVGVDMGALVATYWAQLDWSWPPLAIGKQGQDVKAMVLVSPPYTFKGLRINKPLGDNAVRERISLYFAVGSGDQAKLRETERAFRLVERFHPTASRTEDQTLFFTDDGKFETQLQGAQLLNNDQFDVINRVREFINLRAAAQPFPWKERVDPLN
jgi:pimeloyl-ACP methyl ester carboxylesterase